MSQFFARPGFRKYFANTSWLLGERILRMGVSLFVGIYVARYLGPERYCLRIKDITLKTQKDNEDTNLFTRIDKWG